MDKPAVLSALLQRLRADLAQITAAARSTHAEATSEENKAENKYDTRGLEASYLAHGQSRAAEEAAQAVAQFEALDPRPLGAGEPIRVGALVVLEGAARTVYFVGPRSGGTEVEVAGTPILVVTPSSPLGRQLAGRQAGDSVQLDLGGRRSIHRIATVS